MKISGVAKTFTATNLRLLKQVGVDDFVYYKMEGMPVELDELAGVKRLVEREGLRLSVVEGGPPIDRIVHGKEGRDQQIEQYKKALLNMGELGIGVLCYNFMPQIGSGEMVVRTSYRFPERGGAATSQFRLADVTAATAPHGERPTTDEQMWDNLEYFLKRIVPVAEAAEVKLAMHPDDPPLSPLCGLARIMRSVENFERLLQIARSPVNGITLCQGCFAEMGSQIPEVIRRFAGRIHFAHFRDVHGTPSDFRSTGYLVAEKTVHLFSQRKRLCVVALADGSGQAELRTTNPWPPSGENWHFGARLSSLIERPRDALKNLGGLGQGYRI